MSEADLQAQVCALADITGWRYLHVRKSIGRRDGKRGWQTTTNLKGWPDLLLWRPGRMVAAELKSEKGQTTPEQRDVLASLEAAGVECFVWRPCDWPEIQATLAARTWLTPIEERDEARHAARDALAEREHLLETVCSLREEAAGWRRRAEALYDACDPSMRDDVVGCITTIEGLPEVGG